ncbi:SRPBCC domain-containing protein [Georgenia alba]|uniref:SRPBCC domain-containing protein n=1 Tax=Georgenia alba TaxID=2233858 RepID=A0ABW2Q4Z2_9MICO
MGFPDRIERTVQITRSVEAVWAALTTAEGLTSWFGEEAEIDLRTGGTLTLRWSSGDAVEMRVEKVEPPTLFALTWPVEGLPSGDPRRTYVEFTLRPVDGGTELRVVEHGFAQLPDETYESAYRSHSEGWTNELGELVEYLSDARATG